MKKNISLLAVFATIILFGALSSAHALSIDPLSGELGVSRWETTINSELSIIDFKAWVGYTGTDLNLLYKATPNELDENSLAGSYNTVFSETNTEDGWSGAQITHVLGQPYITGSPIYLYVKEGKQIPAAYAFDLAKLGWNGIDTIELSGFWLGVNGAISHISIYGTHCSVPEPFTMLLLGLGLVGLAGVGRKFKK